MDDSISLLVSILYQDNEQLLKCAVKIKQDMLKEDCLEYPMEPENKMQIYNLLPLHLRSCGPIVNIEFLFDVVIIGDKND